MPPNVSIAGDPCSLYRNYYYALMDSIRVGDSALPPLSIPPLGSNDSLAGRSPTRPVTPSVTVTEHADETHVLEPISLATEAQHGKLHVHDNTTGIVSVQNHGEEDDGAASANGSLLDKRARSRHRSPNRSRPTSLHHSRSSSLEVPAHSFHSARHSDDGDVITGYARRARSRSHSPNQSLRQSPHHSRSSSLEVPTRSSHSLQPSDDSDVTTEDAAEDGSTWSSDCESLFDDSTEDEEPTRRSVDLDHDLQHLGDHVDPPGQDNPEVRIDGPAGSGEEDPADGAFAITEDPADGQYGVAAVKPWASADVQLESTVPSVSRDQSDVSDGGQEYRRKLKPRIKKIRSCEGRRKPDIAMRLLGARQRNWRPQKDFRMYFIPAGTLDAIISERRVLRELENVTFRNSTAQEIVQRVCHDKEEPCLMIFAILAMIRKLDAFDDFIDEKISDRDLPLVKRKRKKSKSSSLYRLCRRSEGSKDGSKGGSSTCLRNWSLLDLDNFYEKQWCVRAVFFSRNPDRQNFGVPHMKIKEDEILPFVPDKGKDGDRVRQGGFGTVCGVRIHPDHHNFVINKKKPEVFAVKTLQSADRQEFDKEVAILKKISQGTNPHRHLITLLLTYEQFGQYHMLFHWAELDLEDYWNQHKDGPEHDVETMTWWAQQLHGIADGLKTIHEWPVPSSSLAAVAQRKEYGRHGDLKPRNILWFLHPEGTRGTLKISDFGLTEFHTRNSRSNIRASRVAGHTFEYCPNDPLVSRTYDIWMLGRVFLELSVWMLGGLELLTRFRRTEFQCVVQDNPGALGDQNLQLQQQHQQQLQQRAASVMVEDHLLTPSALGNPDPIFDAASPATMQFIDELHAHRDCTGYLHDLLDIVQKEMLIKQTGSILRIPAKELAERLSKMLETAKGSPGYILDGEPRERQRAPACMTGPERPRWLTALKWIERSVSSAASAYKAAVLATGLGKE